MPTATAYGSTTSRTDGEDGALWLLVGTDSGFEGPTAIFYRSIDAQLVPRPLD